MTRVSIQTEPNARPDRARPRDRAGEGEGRVQYAILVEQIFREQAQLDPLVHRDRCVEVDEVEIAILQRPRKIERRTRRSDERRGGKECVCPCNSRGEMTL